MMGNASLDPHLVTVEAAMDGLACLQCSIGALALETATTAAVTTTNTDGQDGETCHYLCSHCKTRVSKKDLSNQIRVSYKNASATQQSVMLHVTINSD